MPSRKYSLPVLLLVSLLVGLLLVSLLVGLLLLFLVIASSEDPEWAFCLFGILAIPFVKTRIFSWWKDSPPVFLLVSLLVVLAASFLVILFFETLNLGKDLQWAFRLFG